MAQNTQPSSVILLFIVVLALLFFLYSPHRIPPAQALNMAIPSFHVMNLMEPTEPFTDDDLIGHVSLLNIWTSGCYACRLEHPLLIKIAEEHVVPIYSLNPGDGSITAKAWLQHNGNPYTITGMDSSGLVSMALGVYGTPETFIIDDQGVIRYRYVGALDQAAWENVLLPLVKQYENSQN